MDSNRQLAEQAGAALKQISVDDVEAISGGGTDAPATPEIDTGIVTTDPGTPELATAIINAYEDIVQRTSSLIERLLGPYNSQP